MSNVFDINGRQLRKTHREMALWMCENPLAGLEEIAAWSGYTYAYCSTIINSDAFQSFLRNLEEELRDKVIFPAIRDRLLGATAIALDRLGERLAVERSAAVLTDSAEVLLKSLGYGSPKTPTVAITNNSVVVADKEILARGRALLQQKTSTEGRGATRSPALVDGAAQADSIEDAP